MFKTVVKVFLLLLMVVGVGMSVAIVLEEPLQAVQQADNFWLDFKQQCYEPAWDCHHVIVSK